MEIYLAMFWRQMFSKIFTGVLMVIVFPRVVISKKKISNISLLYINLMEIVKLIN